MKKIDLHRVRISALSFIARPLRLGRWLPSESRCRFFATGVLMAMILALSSSAYGQRQSPDFDVVDSDGLRHRLYNDYLDNGYTVVIKVFFTTCPPCRAIAPQMEPLYQSWGGGEEQVEFFEFSNKMFDTDDIINNYKQFFGITFPSVGQDGDALAALVPFISGDFGTFFGTPTFIVISPDGNVQFDVEFDELDEAIRMTGKVKPGDMPVDTMDMPIDTMPMDTIDMPIDTMPVDTMDMPVDTMDMPIDTMDMPTDTMNMDSVPEMTEFNLNVGSGMAGGVDPLRNVILVITDGQGSEVYRDTSASGTFTVELPEAITSDSSHLVWLSKVADPENGITATDLLLIQKHLLGLTPFDAYWKIIVSDANLNGTVSATDLLYLKRLLLGFEEHFPDGRSWRILHESQLSDAVYTSTPEGVRLSDIVAGVLSGEFVGYKRGDVNGSADPRD